MSRAKLAARRVVIGLAMLLPAACVMPEDASQASRSGPRVATTDAVRPVAAAWSFSFANGTCTASVAHPSAGVTISAGPTATMNLVTRVAAAPGRGSATRVAFNGPGGSWGLRLRRSGAEPPAAAAPLNQAAEGRLRALLTGGTLRLTAGSSPVAVLSVPDAGVAGRDWFGCVSQLGA